MNVALDAQRNRIEAAAAMEAASRIADEGDVEGGREMLRACRKLMNASASVEAPMTVNLMSELESLDAQYTSTAQYRTYGSKYSKMQARSHAVQRAVHTSSLGGGAGS